MSCVSNLSSVTLHSLKYRGVAGEVFEVFMKSADTFGGLAIDPAGVKGTVPLAGWRGRGPMGEFFREYGTMEASRRL